MPAILPIQPSKEPTPADWLIEALGLETRATAEVQDMYSRPVAADAGPAQEHDLAA